MIEIRKFKKKLKILKTSHLVKFCPCLWNVEIPSNIQFISWSLRNTILLFCIKIHHKSSNDKMVNNAFNVLKEKQSFEAICDHFFISCRTANKTKQIHFYFEH